MLVIYKQQKSDLILRQLLSILSFVFGFFSKNLLKYFDRCLIFLKPLPNGSEFCAAGNSNLTLVVVVVEVV